MDSKNKNKNTSPLKYNLRTSIIATLCTATLIILIIRGKGSAHQTWLSVILSAFIGGTITFQILNTGKINKARLLLFITLGIIFGINFTVTNTINRGSILLSKELIEEGEVGVCPIAVPFVIPPLILRGEMIFPSSITSLLSIGFVWLGFALLFGRGWCSWLCFFGGIDQTCASLAKKPKFKLESLGKYQRLFPYAFLLFLILVGLGALYPIYCYWLCPYRIIYDPPAVTTTMEWLSAVIFVTGGLTLLIVGPYLTKKRIYCSFICPLLPANAILGLFSPFRVKIDKDKCNNCGACVNVCETFSMTTESMQKGEATIECSRCGKCMDICPQGAIDYRLIQTNISIRPFFVVLVVFSNIVILYDFVWSIMRYIISGEIGLW
jgi:polyferredoxin